MITVCTNPYRISTVGSFLYFETNDECTAKVSNPYRISTVGSCIQAIVQTAEPVSNPYRISTVGSFWGFNDPHVFFALLFQTPIVSLQSGHEGCQKQGLKDLVGFKPLSYLYSRVICS